MKLISYSVVIIGCFFFSCRASKNSVTQTEIEALDILIKNQQFTIESDWVYPQVTNAMQQVLNSGIMQPGSSAGSISLIGNANFLTISGDSITSYLPYFGERQMQVDYGGTDSAIQFNGLIEDYKPVKNKNQSYDIKFKAKSNNENFNVFIKLYPSLNCEMILNSSSRNSIRYNGNVKPKL
ncbi:DUF4251 domain-containing protein [Thalassobellus citreus]|uniref:DUF4251 domain-containing protein n=1 Tax=Thalassobellus citreus TaxID=3367752 RepID=UPI0037B69EDA